MLLREVLWYNKESDILNVHYSEKIYPHPIDQNCFPHGGDFLEDGYTTEEVKLENETKIFVAELEAKTKLKQQHMQANPTLDPLLDIDMDGNAH